MRPRILVAPVLCGTCSAVWLVWPWIAPVVLSVPWSAADRDLLVVLDGGSARLAVAEHLAGRVPHPPQRLLIRCPLGAPPPQPMPELLQGFDTATQITALAYWLRQQPPPRVAQVWIATDQDHTARAVLLARIALGSQGIRVGPAERPAPSPGERQKLLRDALRLTLWRATGTTGAWFAPDVLARKRADCGA